MDSAHNAYLVGDTTTRDFPGVFTSSIQNTFGGDSDAFVAKINDTGTKIVYSTFLGGSGGCSGEHERSRQRDRTTHPHHVTLLVFSSASIQEGPNCRQG